MKYLFSYLIISICYAQNPDFSLVNINRFTQNTESMPEGKFSSDFIEYKKKRTPILLSLGEKKILGLEKDALYIANFKHNGKHYIAKLKGVKVQGENQVISTSSSTSAMKIIKEKWAVKKRPELQELEAHASMLIEFKQGSGIELIKLQENKRFKDLSKKVTLNKITVSYEAFRSQKSLKVPLLPSGFFDNFAGGVRIYSEQENIRRKLKSINNYEDSIYYLNLEKLKSNKFQKQKNIDPGLSFLLNSVFKADLEGRGATYNALTKNCFSELTSLIDTTFPNLKINKAAHAQSLADTARVQSKIILDFIDELANKKLEEIFDKYEIKLTQQEQRDLAFIKDQLIENLDNAIDNDKLVRESLKKKITKSQSKTLKKYLAGIPIFFEDNIQSRDILSHVTRMTYCAKYL